MSNNNGKLLIFKWDLFDAQLTLCVSQSPLDDNNLIRG